MLKSSQITVFWHLEYVNQIRKIQFFTIDARRATQTKKGNSYFPKKPPAGQQTKMGNKYFQPNCSTGCRLRLRLPVAVGNSGPFAGYRLPVGIPTDRLPVAVGNIP